MATPHVVGALALMLSSTPDLFGDVDGATGALASTAMDIIDMSCGGDDDGDPNNVYGDGRIDAFAAVNLVATGGTLVGTITDADGGDPIAGARVTANNGEREFATTTQADGTYRLFLAAGEYAVSATAFGYETAVAPGVVIETDVTTTQDLALTALPRFTLSGTVYSAESGRPLSGVTVRALGVPVPGVVTGRNGAYSLTLPLGVYTVEARQSGCLSTDTAEVELFADATQDLFLVRVIDDFGHGCAPTPWRYVDARQPTTMYGDDQTGRLPLPFDFPYYGESFDDVFVATNGYLSFTDEFLGFSDFFNVPIPDGNPPNAAVFALWQDLWVVNDDSRVEWDTISQGGRRNGVVIEFSNVGNLGSETGANFEVKLWEDGIIDLVYGEGIDNVGAGGSATIGIESLDGRDGIQLGYQDAFLTERTAYRFSVVPTGFAAGVVTNANDGQPVVGARITAQPGGRTAVTGPDGSYQLRLVPGSYELTATATNYEPATAAVTIRKDRTTTQDFALAAPLAEVSPTEIDATVPIGETTEATVTVTNSGSAALEWEARERDMGGTPPDLPPAPTVHLTRNAEWAPFDVPDGFGPSYLAEPTFEGPLDLIIDDPLGDAEGPVDVTAVLAGADPLEVAMQIDFSEGTPLDETVGYVFLDTDQDPATGLPAEALNGLPTQDIGMEYFIDLFDAPFGVGYVIDANTFEFLGEIAVETIGQSYRFDIPMELLGFDDGSIDTAMVLGDFFAPNDWAPDVGHGTIEPFKDAPWMSEDPAAGTIEPGDSTEVTVTLGGEGIDPADYTGLLVFTTNDPRQANHEVAVSLSVTLPEDFGSVAGTVTNARAGFPLPAEIEVHAERDGAPYHVVDRADDVSGEYLLFAPEGTWPVEATFEGYLPFAGEVTVTAGAATTLDIALEPMWPFATLDGGPLAFELPAGASDTASLTLGNLDGVADLEFEVFELDEGGPPEAAAVDIARPEPAGAADSAAAPEAHTTRAVERRLANGAEAVVFMDALPWDSDALFQVLDANGAVYDVVGSGDMATLALDQYRVVFISNDQPQAFYDAYLDNADRFEDYVDGGGFLWFGAAGSGWNEGYIGEAPLPGPVTVIPDVFEDFNDVVQPDHPVMAGLPDPFEGSSASHSAFDGAPEGSVLATGGFSELPTLLDYEFGGGRVLAIGQTLEFAWAIGQDGAIILENSVPYALAFQPFTDVPWLSVDPAAGVVPPAGAQSLTVTVDTTDLAPGDHLAQVVVRTNDPLNSTLRAEVTLTVTG